MTNNVKLNQNEQFYFESEQVLVTNLRVFTIQKKSFEGEDVWDEIPISDTTQPEPKNAGKISRKPLGINLSLIGLVLMGLQIIPYMLFQVNLLGILGGFFEGLYFLISMSSFTVGVYSPNTTRKADGRDAECDASRTTHPRTVCSIVQICDRQSLG